MGQIAILNRCSDTGMDSCMIYKCSQPSQARVTYKNSGQDGASTESEVVGYRLEEVLNCYRVQV